MVFNLVSYWVLALPIGAWLGLSRGYGLAGIWFGLAIGLGVVASLLVAWIRVRGPAVDGGPLAAAHHV
jgi:MATE family multidrug resistance protein